MKRKDRRARIEAAIHDLRHLFGKGPVDTSNWHPYKRFDKPQVDIAKWYPYTNLRENKSYTTNDGIGYDIKYQKNSSAEKS